MKYISTRDSGEKISAEEAIVRGPAPGGGLYVPETVPLLTETDISTLLAMDYPSRGAYIMSMYLENFSRDELYGYAKAAYSDNFNGASAAPLHILNSDTAVLELYHGPTCAFKDMALQMLPHLLTASLKKSGENREVCILAATSGDTGKAALEGFRDAPGTRIIVFYPNEGVSKVQQLQMTTQEGSNVLVSAVRGNFDDAQSGVKRIFLEKEFSAELAERGYFLTSANSINWGRLLPQIVYYVSAYCDCVNSGVIKLGDSVNVCVPTGNFGNILAASYAKTMGVKIGRLICASNSNKVLTDFIASGIYDVNRAFLTTISPSMDILVSSNLERLLYNVSQDAGKVDDYMRRLGSDGVYAVDDLVRGAISRDFAAGFAGEGETKACIAAIFRETGYLMDTHTAVAAHVLDEYRRTTSDTTPAIIVATASPYKFAESVLSALGAETGGTESDRIRRLQELTGTEPPQALAGLEEKPVRFDGVTNPERMRDVVDSYLA